MKTEEQIKEEIAILIEERKKYKPHRWKQHYVEYLGNRIVTLQWVLGVTESLGD